MSGGGAIPRKRDFLRGVLRKPSKSSPATTTTSQSTTSTTPQAAQSSSASPAQTSLPVRARCKFLDEAFLELSPEERAIIHKHQAQGSDEIIAVVDDAYNAALAKKTVCEDKRWRLKIGGRDVVLRDEAQKVVCWLDRFKSMGDVIANVDPIHIGLPWVGIRMMLEVAGAEEAQMAALLHGMSLTLHMANRLRVYLDYRDRIPLSLALENFDKDLIKMYALLLKFLASAIQVYQKSVATRVLEALWQTSNLETFEAECEKWASRAEIEASNCDRELTARNWQDAKQWKEDLDNQLHALRNIQHLNVSVALLHDKIDLTKLLTAKGAMYDSFADRGHGTCLEGTRTLMLSSIADWAKDLHGKPIFWLCGMAGTGKSTIARTVARMFDKDWHCLGATFFFKRGEGHRGNASRFFPTIAEQLARRVVGMGHALAEALREDPRLCEKTLQDQYDSLISQPLRNATNLSMVGPGLIIVIDAMDECEHNTDVRMILRLLARVENDAALRLRIFITSRPELPVTLGFREMSGSLHRDVRLEEVQAATIDHDIRLYLTHQFDEIRRDQSLKRPYNALPADWPGKDAINELVALAVPLFIFAFTVCRFVAAASPRKRLESILRQQATASFSDLEKTYLPILNQLVLEEEQDISEKIVADFRLVIGSIVLLADPLSVSALGSLLDIDCEDIDDLLEHFHSVLDIPQDRDVPVRLLHLSFRDFLVDKGKQERNQFRIDAGLTHGQLANQCLRLLDKTLREDICNARKPGCRRTDLDAQRIAACIPVDAAYACSYWVWHLEQSAVKLHDHGQVHRFVQSHLLHWLEALSWLGRISSVIASIRTLQSLVQVGEGAQLSAFLYDAQRFALQNRYVVSLAPLQVYHSALIFAPTQSIVKRAFQGCTESVLRRPPEVHSNWGPTLHDLEGHTDKVVALAFSPNEQMLASASRDRTIRLWNTSTGEEVLKLEGHSSEVSAIAFSTKMQKQILASASDDQTVRLWDYSTGEEILKYEMPEQIALDDAKVAFSPDGTMLASADSYQSVKLWSVTTGLEICKFGLAARVRNVAFSPDQQLLASGTETGVIQLWDLALGAELRRLEGHSSVILCVVFLQNDHLLTSSLDEKGVWVWDVTEGKVLSKLGEHDDSPFSVAASSNRKIYVSTSGDRLVRRYNLCTGEETDQLRLSDSVSTMAVSQKAASLALACGQTVRLCDTTFAEESRIWPGHLAYVSAVVFSPSGRILASASYDMTIRLWDATSGEEVHVLKGHSDAVMKLAFSHDGQVLASGSYDKTVRLWCATSGQEMGTFDCSGYVNAMSLSPDGQLLASSCLVKLQLWDTRTRERKFSMEHSIEQEADCALAFSTDGQVLASATYNDVFIRSAATGDCLQRLEVQGPIRNLYFRNDNRALRFAPEPDEGEEAEVELEISSGTLKELDPPTLRLCVDKTWVQYRGQDCLWLPSAYRGRVYGNRASAVFGSKLVIGQGSGAISFFDFDERRLEFLFKDS